MEFRQLQSFLVVAEELHFSRAATKLHLAQSSVSAQIQALEHSLGTPLFERVNRRVRLTEAGEKLKGYARKVVEMTDEIKADINSHEDPRGSLVIRMPESLATSRIPQAVKRFHERYPLVKLRFINCSDTELQQELNSGRLDLAFLIIDSLPVKGVNHEILRPEELVLAAAPSHPLTTAGAVRPSDLNGQTLLLPRTD